MKTEKLFEQLIRRPGSETIMLKVSCKNILRVTVSRGESKASLQKSGVKAHVVPFENHNIGTSIS